MKIVKGKATLKAFCKFQKICIWGLGEHQQVRKRISLSPACNRYKTMFVYRFLGVPITTNLFYELEKII